MRHIERSEARPANIGYRPLALTLTGFRGVKDGLRRDELTLDFRTIPDDARLVAIAGANGRGKTTVMDNLTPFMVMPSRAGANGLGEFSYYDHVYLPESRKELLWEHRGVAYKTQLIFRINGKRRTEAYLFVQREGAWVPASLLDGTRSDGKVETYERCVQGILGNAETFFTSGYSAQGKRQLSAYKNAEIKSLLADLLGLDEVRAQGALAAETAKLLKQGLQVGQQERSALELRARTLNQEIAGLGDVGGRVLAAGRARDEAATRLERAREAQGAVAREFDAAQAATAQRAQIAAQHEEAQATRRSAEALLEQRERREAERSRALSDRIAARVRGAEARWAALQRVACSQRQAVDAAQRAECAAKRLPLAERVAALRDERAQAAQARAERLSAAKVRCQGLRERISGIEREAGQAALRQADLARRFTLSTEVPCVGTDLQGRCKLLSDANEAKALRPAADAQIGALAQRKAEALMALESATAELSSLATAADVRNEAERRLERAVARVTSLAVLARRAGELPQAREALQATQAELASQPMSTVERTKEEQAEGLDIENARVAIAAERARARETFEGVVQRLDAALAALPAAFDTRRVETARQGVQAASRSLELAEAAVLNAVREQEKAHGLVAQLEQVRTKLETAQSRIVRVGAALSVWTLLSQCLGNDGVIALDIDDAGPTLAALANELLLACYGHRFTVEILTLIPTAKGEPKEGFDIVVHDAQSNESKSVSMMSGGERVWINECLTRAIALYLSQNANRSYGTLFSDEADGALDPEHKRMFIDMKRAVLDLGGYTREYFVTQTPELTAMADAVIDMDAMVVSSEVGT